jgi:uncharacterized protein (TIGR03118 family)
MRHGSTARRLRLAGAATIATLAALAVGAPLRAEDTSYQVHVLVSDGNLPADHTDPNLVNGWGVAFNPNAFAWVADNGTGVATLYDGNGIANPLVVTIPPPMGSTDAGNPTGIVFNSSGDFVVTENNVSGPSAFLFATESGVIAGWAPNVDLHNAIRVIGDSSSTTVYKGLALAANGSGHFLYATDFHNGKIDVFDAAFQPATLPGSFTDKHIPKGFAPFGIQNINGNLYVTYAKQDEAAHDDVKGPGLGFVDVFDANGQLIRRLASRGKLNAPWGLALAPANFGRFSNALLVGNFGDGRINAFDLPKGRFLGRLHASEDKPLVIDGLWGIAFGNGVLHQPVNTLFFAAGPNDESNGIYGRIDVTAEDSD